MAEPPLVDLMSSDGDDEGAHGEAGPVGGGEDESREGSDSMPDIDFCRKPRPACLPREAMVHLFVSTRGIYEAEERRVQGNAAAGDGGAGARKDSWEREPGGAFYMVQCSTLGVGLDESTSAAFEERPQFTGNAWEAYGSGCDRAGEPEGWTSAAHALFVVLHGLTYVYRAVPCGVSVVVHIDRGDLVRADAGDAPVPEQCALRHCRRQVRRFNRDGGRVHFSHYSLPLAAKYAGARPRVRAHAMASMYGLARRPHWTSSSAHMPAAADSAVADTGASPTGDGTALGGGIGGVEAAHGSKDALKTPTARGHQRGKRVGRKGEEEEVIEVVIEDDEVEHREGGETRANARHGARRVHGEGPTVEPTAGFRSSPAAESKFTSPEQDSRGWGWGWAHYIRDRATGGVKCPACERVHASVAALRSHASQQVDAGHMSVERILSSKSLSWREELVEEMVQYKKARVAQSQEAMRERSRKEHKRRREREAELAQEEARYFASARARMQAAQRAATSATPKATTPEGIRALAGKSEDLDREISRIVAVATDVDALCFAQGRDAEELKKIFRAYGLVLHPDKCQRPRAAEAFQRISSAYRKMCDDLGKPNASGFSSRAWPRHGEFQGGWGWGWGPAG